MFSPLEFILKWLKLWLWMRRHKLIGWPYSKRIDLHVLLTLLLDKSSFPRLTRFSKLLHWPRFGIQWVYFPFFNHLVHCHIHKVLRLILSLPRLWSMNRPTRLLHWWAVRSIRTSIDNLVVNSATSIRSKLLGLSLFNTVVLYYKIGFLILNITALEARIDLSKLVLVWIVCILLLRHGAEFIVQLGAVVMLRLKLAIGITGSDAHIWININVDILSNVLNGIVVDCVRSLLLLGVVLLLLLIVEVILVTHVRIWVKLIHEWISLHGEGFHRWLLRKLVNLTNLFWTLHLGATAIRNLFIVQ